MTSASASASDLRPLPSYLDSTMIVCFRSCPRRFFHEFVENLAPARLSIDLHAGGCFALALEVARRKFWYDKMPLDDALLFARAAFECEWGDFEIPPHSRTAKTRERVWEAVEAYFAKWSPLTDHIQPHFDHSGMPTLEYSFAIPLTSAEGFPLHPCTSEPFVYCGRFDMLGTSYGRTLPMDEKTTTSIGSTWAKKWDLRNQFLGYVWACRQAGLDVSSMLVRGVGIQVREITLVETEVEFSDVLLDRWFSQLRATVRNLVGMWQRGHFEYNFGDTCTAYGHCAFTDLCQADDPEAWYSSFPSRNWNPLLRNPTKETFDV